MTIRNTNNDSPDQPTNHRPIPKVFFDDLTGAMMRHCISCEQDLLENQSPYFIEKAIKPHLGYQAYATIFEYAMCFKCMDTHKNKISKSSLANINQFFMEHVDVSRRQYLVAHELYDDLDLWMGHCLVTDKHVTAIGECQIYAQCLGDQLVMGDYPYMISSEALDAVVNLLSNETIDEFNKLKDELVGPPAFQDLLKDGPRVLL
ncbi:hypothetical protein N7E81_14720 [Reichenbachiella carrageenanivorans]|uniref:Uncharacterized protein n=1 Tax=Reichenbachiella carrageenanivorans TaxID=2979869 RepID=A0ABY6CXG3_9BACT|nr:hypothetical protein [Reichenbachiella carrageenanivorans]UXX78612.1 hypothetical protein N7E81_14720 [Reichenbachiella carrageenanivorans]